MLGLKSRLKSQRRIEKKGSTKMPFTWEKLYDINVIIKVLDFRYINTNIEYRSNARSFKYKSVEFKPTKICFKTIKAKLYSGFI